MKCSHTPSSWVVLRPLSRPEVSQEDKKKRTRKKAALRQPTGTKETIKHPTRAQYNGDSKIGSELQNDVVLPSTRPPARGKGSHTWKQPFLRPRHYHRRAVPHCNQQTAKIQHLPFCKQHNMTPPCRRYTIPRKNLILFSFLFSW